MSEFAHPFPVRGESFRQDALVAMLARHPDRKCWVTISPEPTNPHDPKAAKICDLVTDTHLGYLPADIASDFQQVVAYFGKMPVQAELTGGTETHSLVGIVIDGGELKRMKDPVARGGTAAAQSPVAPPIPLAARTQTIASNSTEKKCRFCSELIQRDAAVCKHCGRSASALACPSCGGVNVARRGPMFFAIVLFATAGVMLWIPIIGWITVPFLLIGSVVFFVKSLIPSKTIRYQCQGCKKPFLVAKAAPAHP